MGMTEKQLNDFFNYCKHYHPKVILEYRDMLKGAVEELQKLKVKAK